MLFTIVINNSKRHLQPVNFSCILSLLHHRSSKSEDIIGCSDSFIRVSESKAQQDADHRESLTQRKEVIEWNGWEECLFVFKCVWWSSQGHWPPDPWETLPPHTEMETKTSALTQKSQFTLGMWDKCLWVCVVHFYIRVRKCCLGSFHLSCSEISKLL